MQLQERDRKILNYIVLFGFLTSQHLSELLTASIKVMQRRLRKMVRAGYLKRLPVPTTTLGACPCIYFLGAKAEDLLQIKSSRPRLNAAVSHQLKNNSLMVQALQSAGKASLQCFILPEHTIRAENASISLIPDGAFCLSRNGRKALFMLESDAGTMILKSHSFYTDIENKFLKYREMFTENSIEYYRKFFSHDFNRFRLLYIAEDDARQRSVLSLAESLGMNFVFVALRSCFENSGLNSEIWHSPSFGKEKKRLIE